MSSLSFRYSILKVSYIATKRYRKDNEEIRKRCERWYSLGKGLFGGKECFSRMMELDMKLLAADIEEIKLRMVDVPTISREDKIKFGIVQN